MMEIIINRVPLHFPMRFLSVGEEYNKEDEIQEISAGTAFRLTGAAANELVITVVTKDHKYKGKQFCVPPSIIDKAFTDHSIEQLGVNE